MFSKIKDVAKNIGKRSVATNPTISVIIPVYNVEKYIDQCLTSVRNQSFEDIEIICVNDCTPDNSWDIVLRHAQEDDRLVLIEHDVNKGLGGARNSAIAAARADFLASVDSDDYMVPHMLETLWNASNEGDVDIVCCAYENVKENGDKLHDSVRPAAEYDMRLPSQDIFNIINPAFWNKIWRKSLFTKNKITFPQGLYYEDLPVAMMLLAKCKSLKIIEDVLYKYRQNENSITNNYSEKHLADFFTVHQMIFEFLKKQKTWSRHKAHFFNFFEGSTATEFENLKKSNLDDVKKLQLAKNLFMLKAGFYKMHEQLYVNDMRKLKKICKELKFE